MGMLLSKKKYRKIIYYEKRTGKKPVEEFLNQLHPKIQKKVFFVFSVIEEFQRVSTKFLKRIIGSDYIWEIRVEYQSNIYRFLGFFNRDKLIILTNGFQKKSQKTPESEISLSMKYKKDYMERTAIK